MLWLPVLETVSEPLPVDPVTKRPFDELNVCVPLAATLIALLDEPLLTVMSPPFDVNEAYVREIAGVPMSSYIDWMKSCYFISVIGHPAVSVPCGLTSDGLPVGLQIVGRDADDWRVLQLAHAFERVRGPFPMPPHFKKRTSSDYQ